MQVCVCAAHTNLIYAISSAEMRRIMPYLLGALIAIYAGYVIYKKVKDIRAGKFCSCGCSDCPTKIKCHK
jgi:hypothetical protein